MAAARTVATPASTAFPPCSRMRMPAATSRLLPAPTMKCVPRTAGYIVEGFWANAGSAAARTTRALKLCFVVAIESFGNWNSGHFDAVEVCAADAELFGQQQSIVALLERRGSFRGTRVVAHHRRRHRIRIHRVQARNQHARLNG